MKRTVVSCFAVLAGVVAVVVASHAVLACQEDLSSSNSDSSRSTGSLNNKFDQDNEESCSHPELRDELASRVKVDQEIRGELIEAVSSQEKSAEGNSAMAQMRLLPMIAKLGKIDQQNREWLIQQIDEHGWLGKSIVGKSGAHNAWLLVQHADKDLKFQKRCLELMKSAEQGEVAAVDIAYLTDRVLVAEGKPQTYGTQCIIENGKPVAKNVEDRENLDKRRKALGLEPMDQYLKQFEEAYQVKPSDGNDN